MDRHGPKLRLPPVSQANAAPLYRQIIDGVQAELAAGRLHPGDALPSFRALAEDLLVSVITVKRAYEELERAGILYRRQGLGTFVAESGAERHRAAKRDEARDLLRQALDAAREAGLTPEQCREWVRRELEGDDAS